MKMWRWWWKPENTFWCKVRFQLSAIVTRCDIRHCSLLKVYNMNIAKDFQRLDNFTCYRVVPGRTLRSRIWRAWRITNIFFQFMQVWWWPVQPYRRKYGDWKNPTNAFDGRCGWCERADNEIEESWGKEGSTNINPLSRIFSKVFRRRIEYSWTGTQPEGEEHVDVMRWNYILFTEWCWGEEISRPLNAIGLWWSGGSI